MPKKPISREYRIYLALWRKAYNERGKNLPEVFANGGSLNTAISIRQGMYRAIVPYRSGEQFDPDLAAAAELFVVYLDKENFRIILRERKSLSVLDLSELGLSEDDLMLSEEKGVLKELETMVPEVKKVPNKFY